MAIKRNVGGIDRFLRIGISLLMVFLGFFNSSIISDELAGNILGIFGLAILLVAVVGFSPLYAAIGFDTCNKQQKNIHNACR